MPQFSLLKPLLLDEILNTDRSMEKENFKTWVASGKYLVQTVNESSVIIYANDISAFSEAMAHSAGRMASASFETMSAISPIKHPPKSYAWSAIQAYYAAFFSAHAIMRCFGHVSTQLESGHIKTLNTYAAAVGITQQLKSKGQYCGHFDRKTSNVIINRAGNPHEDTWFQFIACLRSLSMNVLTLKGITTSLREISSYIDDMVLALTRRGQYKNGNWLSAVRNQINYQHEYCAWYPYGRGKVINTDVNKMIQQWRSDNVDSGRAWRSDNVDIREFFILSTQIVNFCYLLMEEINRQSKHPSNTFSRMPKGFLNLLDSPQSAYQIGR